MTQQADTNSTVGYVAEKDGGLFWQVAFYDMGTRRVVVDYLTDKDMAETIAQACEDAMMWGARNLSAD